MDTKVTKQNEIAINDNPQSLIALAIEKGLDINQLEKLLGLKERYDQVQANKAFISSMSNFQKDVPEIQKKKLVNFPSKTGGMVNYKYAELGEIDETIKGPMAANGLSKRWEIKDEGEKLICTCIISHIDGHREETTMSSIKDASGNKNEIQSRASAISYLQRYTLIGALGLTTASEDNDAIGTPEVKQTTQTEKEWKEDGREWLSESNYKDAILRIKRGEKGVLEEISEKYKMKKTYKSDMEMAIANFKTAVKQELIPNGTKWNEALKYLAGSGSIEEVEKKYYISAGNREKLLSEAI